MRKNLTKKEKRHERYFNEAAFRGSSDLSDDDADIGSTVEQVVLRSACPVASVTRPEAR